MPLCETITIASVVVLFIVLALGGIYYYWSTCKPTYVKYAGQNLTCDLSPNCDVVIGSAEATVDACQARCDSTSGCEGFLFQRTGAGSGNNCWLKKFADYPPKMTPWALADFYLNSKEKQ
ncbi:uncharacterized protein ACA1_056920 [Acanthamoeba castellanii str. Neff]|uniref:Apple domain-containing protein n=1 Tax=Acanthamoeba castellanii (strain ATCC 30010 / Neff) TaxID=1257118 RepID=L8GYA1_ACACF|nr:uncharacterized protein ACA1_056920 [Acanthamoeba castellanii str. Neff]ELR17061.1 hypothetical protein ACA1_056920 [Acanthamoeba castellanii str. Neff]